eukprot:TRINITY_DN12398_c0_g2_i6.p1 TRINITY_DN12398_c0_g2~~TRINITY_DN12398_c0_g2_i6.p1  ORF type:complete len:128 (+),score=0.41 TRINITY_DN12398_c0_g2_i6:370-753(+)
MQVIDALKVLNQAARPTFETGTITSTRKRDNASNDGRRSIQVNIVKSHNRQPLSMVVTHSCRNQLGKGTTIYSRLCRFRDYVQWDLTKQHPKWGCSSITVRVLARRHHACMQNACKIHIVHPPILAQ